MGLINPALWIIIGLLIIVIDLVTINFITPIGLGLMAFGAVEYFNINVYIAVAIAVLTAIITYYPFFKLVRSDTKEKQATPEDEYVGKEGKVVEVIDDDEARVEIGGEVFYAITAQPVQVGDKVIVDKIEGVKVYVHKKE